MVTDLKDRLRTSVVREHDRIAVKILFDDVELSERIIMSRDLIAAKLVEQKVLRITADSRLVHTDDGTPYKRRTGRGFPDY